MLTVVDGKPQIDWSSMNNLKSKWSSAASRALNLQSLRSLATTEGPERKRCKGKRRRKKKLCVTKRKIKDLTAQNTASIAELFEEIPEPSGPPTPGLPRVAAGSARLSYGEDFLDAGAPPGPLTPFCPYCKRLGLLLGEAGVKYELVQIDLSVGKKPEWYTRAYAPGEVPAVQGLPGFGEPGTWQGGFDECVKAFTREYPSVQAVLDRPSPLIAADAVFKYGERVCFTGVAMLMLETKEGQPMLQGMASMGFSDAEEAKQRVLEAAEAGRYEEAREACKAHVLHQLHEIRKVLERAEAGGGFLGGEAPCYADISVGPIFAFTKAMVDTGFIDVGQVCGLDSLDTLGLGAIDRFLERWTRRPAWAETFLSTNTFNAVGLRSMMTKVLVKDTMTPEVMNPIFARARAMDARYGAMLKLVALPSAYVDVEEALSCSESESDSESSDGEGKEVAQEGDGDAAFLARMKQVMEAEKEKEEYMDGTICL